jgi:hypothetical protein
MSNIDATQNELAQLRAKVAQLEKQLGERQQLPATKLPTLARDPEFVIDMSRFAEGVLSEKQVRKKYHLLEEADWERLATDEPLIEAIELERTRRIRSGATKRELAQNHIVAAPKILNDLMTDPKQSAKHRIDAVARLDALTGDTTHAETEMDRVIVSINLGADTKLRFEGSVRPDPNSSKVINGSPDPVDDKIIDVTPVDEPPPKRGPGRPPGSKNKPKTTDRDDAPPLPGST